MYTTTTPVSAQRSPWRGHLASRWKGEILFSFGVTSRWWDLAIGSNLATLRWNLANCGHTPSLSASFLGMFLNWQEMDWKKVDWKHNNHSYQHFCHFSSGFQLIIKISACRINWSYHSSLFFRIITALDTSNKSHSSCSCISEKQKNLLYQEITICWDDF